MKQIRVTFTDMNQSEMPVASSIHVIIPTGFSEAQAILFLSNHVCEEMLNYAAQECISMSKDEE